MSDTRRFDDIGECVDAALRRLGSRIVIATPLAIGKPNALLNEFYRRAARDPTLELLIVTALSPSLLGEVVGRRPVSFAADPAERRRRRGPVQPTLELLVGDSSGARAQISVPYDRR